METADEVAYAFVIQKAYINSNDQVVFTVSTKEISLQNNTSKKLIQIPCGKFINMRFDIDATNIINEESIDDVNNLISSCKMVRLYPAVLPAAVIATLALENPCDRLREKYGLIIS